MSDLKLFFCLLSIIILQSLYNNHNTPKFARNLQIGQKSNLGNRILCEFQIGTNAVVDLVELKCRLLR